MTTKRFLAGGILALGAIVMLAATFLTWATISGPATTVTVSGLNTDGYITDGFAIAFLVAAFALARQPRTWLSVVATIGTLAGLGWAVIVLSAISNFSSLYPDTTASGVSVTAGLGVIVAVAGSAAALIGAIASFFARAHGAAMPGAQPTTAGVTR